MDRELKDLRVLVVEDSLEAASLIHSMLQEIGINQVFTSKDGRHALDFLGTCDDLVDLVLCDWKMPRMSGLDLLRQLRTVDANLPFIMITGVADTSSVHLAMASGVTAYIRKPFSSQQLKKKLRVMTRIISLRDN